MFLQIPCDLPFLFIPLHCPMPRRDQSCLFSPSKCVFGSRVQALTMPSDCRALALSRLLTFSEEGRKGLSPCLSHTYTHTHTHTHTRTHARVRTFLRIKHILWCKLIHLVHHHLAIISKVLVPIWEPWEENSWRGSKLEIGKDSKRNRELREEPWPLSKNSPHWWPGF